MHYKQVNCCVIQFVSLLFNIQKHSFVNVVLTDAVEIQYWLILLAFYLLGYMGEIWERVLYIYSPINHMLNIWLRLNNFYSWPFPSLSFSPTSLSPLLSAVRVVLGQHVFNDSSSNTQTYGIEKYEFYHQYVQFNPTVHDIGKWP